MLKDVGPYPSTEFTKEPLPPIIGEEYFLKGSTWPDQGGIQSTMVYPAGVKDDNREGGRCMVYAPRGELTTSTTCCAGRTSPATASTTSARSTLCARWPAARCVADVYAVGDVGVGSFGAVSHLPVPSAAPRGQPSAGWGGEPSASPSAAPRRMSCSDTSTWSRPNSLSTCSSYHVPPATIVGARGGVQSGGLLALLERELREPLEVLVALGFGECVAMDLFRVVRLEALVDRRERSRGPGNADRLLDLPALIFRDGLLDDPPYVLGELPMLPVCWGVLVDVALVCRTTPA